MNKTHFSNILAELEGELITVEFERDRLIALGDAALDSGAPWTAEQWDEVNALHDRVDELNDEIRSTDNACFRRKWTAAHYNTYNLIASNCD